MIGWILHACHRQPTVMNGAVMKNFVTPAAPFASALVGDPELFVSEVDESDGSIALYQPEIAVLTNISLDHKEMDELRGLFAALPAPRRARRCSTSTIRRPGRSPTSCRRPSASATASTAPARTSWARTCSCEPDGVTFALEAEGERHEVRLAVPGRHNASNALAAHRGRRARSACGSRTRSPRSAASRASSAGSKPSARRRA